MKRVTLFLNLIKLNFCLIVWAKRHILYTVFWIQSNYNYFIFVIKLDFCKNSKMKYQIVIFNKEWERKKHKYFSSISMNRKFKSWWICTFFYSFLMIRIYLIGINFTATKYCLIKILHLGYSYPGSNKKSHTL